MSLQVHEITNFKSGIDLTLDPILSPSDAFVNLKNGFVHKGVLQSRPGFKPFATGPDSSGRLVSRLSNEITNETVATGSGTDEYTFTLANEEVERTDVVITAVAPSPSKTITFSYDPENRTVTANGDTLSSGDNDINYQTGEITVKFDEAIASGNINATYNYHPSEAVVGIHEYVQAPDTRDLIILDQSRGYKYDASGNDFDLIPFASGVGPFNSLTDGFFTFQNWRLHSKGAVPNPSGSLELKDRLFFTNNQDEPFVYDGTNIDVISNMDEFRQPVEGSLDKSVGVVSFGQRLCWLGPTLGGEFFGQAVLWGPINDNEGLALDYQASGSGILSSDTDSNLRSFKFVRNNLVVWFNTDVYVLELTQDAFQPFRWRLLEEERGTEPRKSAVSFLGNVESVGRLGILSTDGRRVERADQKIPFFTRDDINPGLIEHIYGEEMEEDSQFWWTYPDFTPDLTTSNKILVKNFEEQNYAIYDLPVSVFNKTVAGGNITWDNLTEVFGNPDPDDPDVEEDFDGPVADVIWDKWGLRENTYKTLFGDHNGFIFSIGRSLNDGSALIAPKAKDGNPVTTGDPTTIEVEYHHFKVNDVVTFRGVGGMTELNGRKAEVVNVPDRSSITVRLDSNDFSAYTEGGEVVKLVDFEAEFVPFNPMRSRGMRTYLGKMDFLVGGVVGKYEIDFFEDRSSTSWTEPDKTYEFDVEESTDRDIWFSIYVDEVADFHRWRIRQNVLDEKITLKSIRLFFKEEGVSNI